MSKKKVNDNPDFVVEKVVEAMTEKKGHKIVVLDLSEIPNAVTKYFVICHAQSKTQVDAIYDFVLEHTKKECGINPYRKEGYQNAEWILIDYIDVVVHIFREETRNFYALEELWGDAKFKYYSEE